MHVVVDEGLPGTSPLEGLLAFQGNGRGFGGGIPSTDGRGASNGGGE
jgi:hypothetical protein